MQRYEQIQRTSKKDLIINSFIGGVMWGLGATIGVSIILAILGFTASRVNVIPVIGTFVSQVLDYVLKSNQHLR